MPKRKYQPDEKLEPYAKRLKDLYEELFKEGGDDLAGLAILHLSAEARMTITDLQKPKASSPSFSAAKWGTVAPALGLRADLDFDQLDLFTVPIAILPPSFHRELMMNASRWMDVYQEPPNHKQEEAQVRLLEAWYVPVCSLFNGRLVDKPETPMPETLETFRGEVEHEVFLFDNLILLVINMKFTARCTQDYYAQVLLELISALKLNRDIDLDPQPPIYAVLSDLHYFYFLSYDGDKFRWMSEITIPNRPREQFMEGMTHVSDLLFSILLNGYISMLQAVENLCIRRGQQGDISQQCQHSSSSAGTSIIEKPARQTSRPPLGNWSKALLKAREAQTILVKPDLTSEDTWENDGRRGMDVLNESLKNLPKIGSRADWDKDASIAEIDSIMDQVMETNRLRKGFKWASVAV